MEQLKSWLPVLIILGSIIAAGAVAQSKIGDLEEKHREATDDIAKLREEQHGLDNRVERGEVRQENMLDILKEIKQDVKEIKRVAR